MLCLGHKQYYRNVDARDKANKKATDAATKVLESRRKELLSHENYWGSGDATSPEGRKAIDDALKASRILVNGKRFEIA